jgi:uncharacterized membrane protein YccC
MIIKPISRFIIAKKDPPSRTHAARTAVATVLSLLVARLLRLPDDYWAAISCLIVMQSTLGASVPMSVQCLAGTAVGAALGALAAGYVRGSALAFGVLVLAIGLLCSALRIEKSAFRHACVTLSIVMFSTSPLGPRTIALHRFGEFSLGIAMALALTAVWPETHPLVVPVESK